MGSRETSHCPKYILIIIQLRRKLDLNPPHVKIVAMFLLKHLVLSQRTCASVGEGNKPSISIEQMLLKYGKTIIMSLVSNSQRLLTVMPSAPRMCNLFDKWMKYDRFWRPQPSKGLIFSQSFKFFIADNYRSERKIKTCFIKVCIKQAIACP